ncbi:hypothetical protein CSIRO_3020 [Bradyrhizobiaceae bacterium SG-6C]|nr:hypothetical protein CSIRO_3020 [Bradyrhizobiaceae bacterium SG-6C]
MAAIVAGIILNRYRYDHESVTIRALSMFQGDRYFSVAGREFSP